MTGYSAKDVFTPAEIYDLSDLVKGGPIGDANVPLIALADQANYVRNRLMRWEGVKSITGNYTLDSIADLRQFLTVQIADNKSLTLPDASNLPLGTRIPISTAITGIKALTVQSQNGQRILDGSISWVKWDTGTPGIYMHDCEKLILVGASDHWVVESAIGNFYSYGDSYGARIQRGNVLIAQGSLYNRADVPRLALLINQGGPAVVSDTTWLSNPAGKPVYRGCYSTGNGVSTLRLPDERGMFDRYLDMGRGLDLYRLYGQPGGYEPEMIGPHSHTINSSIGTGIVGIANGSTPNQRISGGGHDGGSYPVYATDNNAGAQNIVMNIGKIPLIKY